MTETNRTLRGLSLFSSDKRPLAILRGAGDLATGVIQALCRAGFRVIALEIEKPSAIRREVALATAFWRPDQRMRVENMEGVVVSTAEEALALASSPAGSGAGVSAPATRTSANADAHFVVPLLADPEGNAISHLAPDVVVDAILAKRNLGTHPGMAPWVIALGPGFSAPEDCDVVIETMRGHKLGRVITEGPATPNTGIPGEVGGQSARRVIHAPAAGTLRILRDIGEVVEEYAPMAEIAAESGTITIRAPFKGLIRGMLPDGYPVYEGLKMADVDPRAQESSNAKTISDKARTLGGSVLQAIGLGVQRSWT